MPNHPNYETAQSVLTQYDVPATQLTFLGSSQNTTFRVETETGDRFLLRLHAGIETASNEQELWRQPSVILSELLWLNAIAQETELTVPQPMQNRSGEWVTILSSGISKDSIAASLLRWVNGEHSNSDPTPQQVHQLGRLMAQLHHHANSWSLPAGFSRPTHHVEQLKAATVQLGELVKTGVISTEDYQVFQQVAAQVEEFILSLQQPPADWGLIHADLHSGNYVLHEQEVRPIDFSRCGFGFYLYDIGESLGDIDASLRPAFFTGYTSLRRLPADYLNRVEAFFNGATIENFAFLSAKPQEHEWLARAVPYVVQHHFHPYLQGDSFLFHG